MKKIINIDIFKTQVVVVIGELEDVKSMIPRKYKSCITHMENDPNYFATAVNGCFSKQKNHIVTVIHSKSRSMGIIAHEAVHAAYFTANTLELDIAHDDGELIAYFVELICVEVEKELRKEEKKQ